MDEEKNVNAPDLEETEMVMPEGMSQQEPEAAHHNRIGVVLGLLIVLLLIILAGMYLWFSTSFQRTPAPAPAPVVEREVPDMPNEPEMENADAAVQQLETVSTSDEIDAIEADVEATDLDELDAELNAIEAELDAAL